jgi:hypothetical protein
MSAYEQRSDRGYAAEKGVLTPDSAQLAAKYGLDHCRRSIFADDGVGCRRDQPRHEQAQQLLSRKCVTANNHVDRLIYYTHQMNGN